MLGTAIIVFRETLEAALIIGIIAAATQQVPGRTRWLVGGLLAGLAGAGVVAVSTEAIAEMASGVGQELFNAAVLGVAVLMLAWHNIWMSQHGRELAAHARNTGRNISDGTSECSILFVIIALAVLREGSETVLFLYGIAASADQGSATMLSGGLLGLGAGVLVGWTLYSGLLRIPLSWFFNVTSVLVLLMAAGMASQSARFLIQADVLPSLATPLWDTSGLLPSESPMGMLLQGLTGYDARPSGMQMVFFAIALVSIAFGMRVVNRKPTFKTN